MGIINFINASAFILSILVKILALPFLALGKILHLCKKGILFCASKCIRCIKQCKLKLKQYKEKRRIYREKKKERRIIQEHLRTQRKRHKKKQRLKRARKNSSKKKPQSKLVKILKYKDTDCRIVKYSKNFLRIAYYTFKRYFAIMSRISQKVYWISHTVCQKLYWKSHAIYRKIYWKCRTTSQKIYWKLFSVYQKIYWRIRGLFQKIYWKSYTLYQKIYWKCRTLFQRIYWKTKTTSQRLYWLYYVQSRRCYNFLSQNVYADLFFVFFRGYLKKQKPELSYLKILGVKEYVQRYEPTGYYAITESGRERTVCIPEFFEKSTEKLERFTSPDIYVAEISEACLIGGSNAITVKKFLLNDTAYYDSEKRIDIRYSVIKTVINQCAIIEDTKITEVIEKGINLVGAASFNYYHLVVEILSRLSFVDGTPKYRNYPILVDEVVLRIPQFYAALNCVNKHSHPVVKIEKGKKYQVQSLVIPSSNVWMPTNLYKRDMIRSNDFLISKTVLDNIRNAVGITHTEKAWRKIFISRKNTQAVRLKNEEVIRDIFAENGFEIVFTEEMSFRQQVECFGQAKYVIAASGAGLTNIIFCQPDTVIGCIIPSCHRFYMYSTIAHLLNLKPVFLDADIIELTPYAAADTFVLDVNYVERYINYIKKYDF